MTDSENGDTESKSFSPLDVSGYISNSKLDQILEEVSKYEVELVEDPTLPELGSKYIQAKIAKCRYFLNRSQHYLQITKRFERNLKRSEKTFELDLELKIAGLLADDIRVRQQPAVQERRALAISLLHAEHENLADFKLELQGLEDAIRIIKSRYDDLRHTNQDIKLQRQLIKDDRLGWENEGGFITPHSRADGTIPGGLPPAVKVCSIDPKDILDPSKRPEDLPEPKNASHAKMISSFFGSGRQNKNGDLFPVEPMPEGVRLFYHVNKEESIPDSISYDDLLSEK